MGDSSVGVDHEPRGPHFHDPNLPRLAFIWVHVARAPVGEQRFAIANRIALGGRAMLRQEAMYAAAVTWQIEANATPPGGPPCCFPPRSPARCPSRNGSQ